MHELELEPSDRVLVCLVNNPRDLAIARWDHWYRLPIRHAPVDLPDVLAFYLSAAFEDERYTIQEYARVRGHELVRRCDLFPEQRDHPRASEVYYKLVLEPLRRLVHPIPALRLRRFSFIQSTGDRLLHALDVSELADIVDRQFVRLMEEEAGYFLDSDEQPPLDTS
jgi:hypothetical protein